MCKSPYRKEISELEHTNSLAGTWQAADDQLLAGSTRRVVSLYKQKIEEAFTQAILCLEKKQEDYEDEGTSSKIHH